MPETADVAIDGYRDLVRIAIGGFSIVYRGRQTRFDRTVAVKVINADPGDAGAMRRFTRECQAAGRLFHHPEIATVLEAGATADGRPFLAMQYYPHGSLADRLRSAGPLAATMVVAVAADVTRALAAAHAAGVLHRDLKPGNLLVTDGGGVALTDFGVAAVVAPSGSASSQSAFTPQYTAPEVLEGRPYTQAADVYALGVTMHTLLAGSPPFTPRPGEGPAAVLRRITGGDAVPLPDDQPEALRELIARMMAVEPTRRPGTGDVQDLLTALAVSVGSAPLPTSPTDGAVTRPDAAGLVVEADLVAAMSGGAPGGGAPAGTTPSQDGTVGGTLDGPGHTTAAAATTVRRPEDGRAPELPAETDPSGRRPARPAPPHSGGSGPRLSRRRVLVVTAAVVAAGLLVVAIYLPLRLWPDSDRRVGGGGDPPVTSPSSGAPGPDGTTPAGAETAAQGTDPEGGANDVPGTASSGAGPGDQVTTAPPSPSPSPSPSTSTSPQPPPPPQPPPNTFRVPAGTLSPQLIDGTCVFRIWYGNFGDAPFAKVRVYAGSCGGLGVTVISRRGADTLYSSDTDWSGGTDECGSYFEGQATGTDPAVAVGQRLTFAETGRVYSFLADSGEPVSPYARC